MSVYFFIILFFLYNNEHTLLWLPGCSELNLVKKQIIEENILDTAYLHGTQCANHHMYLSFNP